MVHEGESLDLTTEKEKGKFSDELDVVKHIIKVHTKDTRLTEDHVLFEPDDSQKTFIRKQVNVADRIASFIKDPDAAREAADGVVRVCNHIAILERNKKANFLVKSLVEKSMDAQEYERKGAIEGLKNLVLGRKKTEEPMPLE